MSLSSVQRIPECSTNGRISGYRPEISFPPVKVALQARRGSLALSQFRHRWWSHCLLYGRVKPSGKSFWRSEYANLLRARCLPLCGSDAIVSEQTNRGTCCPSHAGAFPEDDVFVSESTFLLVCLASPFFGHCQLIKLSSFGSFDFVSYVIYECFLVSIGRKGRECRNTTDGINERSEGFSHFNPYPLFVFRFAKNRAAILDSNAFGDEDETNRRIETR